MATFSRVSNLFFVRLLAYSHTPSFDLLPMVAGLRENDDEMRQREARSRIRSALSRTLRSDVGVRPEELCAPARCGSLGVDVPLRKKIR